MKHLPGSKVKVVATSGDYTSVLKLLPVEIAELVSSLSPEDLEILAYLIASSSETRADAHPHGKRSKKTTGQCEGRCHKPFYDSVSVQISHDNSKLSQQTFNVAVQLRKPALFECNCFQCYTSYWSRWDSSPNRGLIDEAIALYEEHIDNRKSQRKSKGAGTEKLDRKNEAGKGRGRRGQVKYDASFSAKDQNLPEETQKAQQERKETTSSNDVSRVNNSGIKGGNNRHGKSGSSNSPTKAHGSKDQQSRREGRVKSGKANSINDKTLVIKDGTLKSSRVAPFAGASNGNDEKEMFGLESDSKGDPSALYRGRNLVSFVANRLWGLWDRSVPDRMVDVY